MNDAALRPRRPRGIARWHRDGFVLAAAQFDPEAMEELVQWARGSAAGARVCHGADDEREPPSSTSPLAMMASDLLGGRVVLQACHLVDDRAGRDGFAAHQDAAARTTSSVLVEETVACGIAVDATTVGSGCLEIAPARHRDLLVGDVDGHLPDSAARALRWRPIPMSEGDVVWLHARAPHRHAPTSSRARSIWLTFRVERPVPDAETANGLARSPVSAAIAQPPTGRRPRTSWSFEPSRLQNDASGVADALVELYERRGGLVYGDGVDHTSHALQAGSHAMAQNASLAMIVAAFLHDVGHLLVDDDLDVPVLRAIGGVTSSDGHAQGLDGSASSRHGRADSRRDGASTLGDADHARRGADVLSLWFPAEVTEPIRFHMSPDDHRAPSDEVDIADAPARRLREWDTMSNVPGAPTPALDTFRSLIESVVSFGHP